MLIQFRVENHRSLRDEQVLSLVAADTGDPADRRLLRRPGLQEALLPAVALYGANASGKSNVLSALLFMWKAVHESHRLWEPDGGPPREPFALSGKATEPSLYEVDILVSGIRHRYGFALGAARVEEEWLHAWPGGQKQVLFEREGNDFAFGAQLRGENDTIRALTRANSLFLSAAAQNNHETILPIFSWFRASRFDMQRWLMSSRGPVDVAVLGEMFAPRQHSPSPQDNAEQERERAAIVRLLKAADIGIRDLKVVSQELHPDASSLVPGVYRLDLFLRHNAEDQERAWLPLRAQSAGTVTLLSIAARLVRVLRLGSLLCIDELEASLHPMLALELVRLFNDPEQNPHGAQLVFTTHDTNLLGNVVAEPPLRRDQIWFTEKDQCGATHLYPLTDFHPRAEENLERGYLQGRYGAIPFLGRLAPPLDDQEEG